MNDTLQKYLRFAELLAGTAIICGAFFGAHHYIQSERAEERKIVVGEYEKKLQEQKDLAEQERKLMQGQVDLATKGGKEREDTIRNLAAANTAAATGLRDTARAISGSLSGLSGDALRSLAGAYGNILGECQGRRNGLAEEAERLNSEKRTLIEAWPKKPIQP